MHCILSEYYSVTESSQSQYIYKTIKRFISIEIEECVANNIQKWMKRKKKQYEEAAFVFANNIKSSANFSNSIIIILNP